MLPVLPGCSAARTYEDTIRRIAADQYSPSKEGNDTDFSQESLSGNTISKIVDEKLLKRTSRGCTPCQRKKEITPIKKETGNPGEKKKEITPISNEKDNSGKEEKEITPKKNEKGSEYPDAKKFHSLPNMSHVIHVANVIISDDVTINFNPDHKSGVTISMNRINDDFEECALTFAEREYPIRMRGFYFVDMKKGSLIITRHGQPEMNYFMA